MELLWPDLGARAARNNLHQTVHSARRVFGARHLTLEDGMLGLDGVECDVAVFEALAADARSRGDPSAYVSALDSFGGKLLPEDRYEQWAEARQTSLNDLHSLVCSNSLTGSRRRTRSPRSSARSPSTRFTSRPIAP